MLVDAHNHFQNTCFDSSREEIWRKCKHLKIQTMLVNGTSCSDWENVADLANKYPEVLPVFGLHPLFIENLSEDWKEQLQAYLNHFPKAHIGEIGLDKRAPDILLSEAVFEEQLELSKQYNRPVTIHCVGTYGRCLEILKHQKLSKAFLLHSYAGSIELAKEFIKLGAYFSVNASICYKGREKLRKMIRQLPIERILIETDAPYMGFNNHADKAELNRPDKLSLVLEQLAACLAKDVDILRDRLYENSSTFVT